MLADKLGGQLRPLGLEVHHIIQVLLILGDQGRQVDDENAVLLPHLPHGLVESGIELYELAHRDPGIRLKALHGLKDLGVGIGLADLPWPQAR